MYYYILVDFVPILIIIRYISNKKTGGKRTDILGNKMSISADVSPRLLFIIQQVTKIYTWCMGY